MSQYTNDSIDQIPTANKQWRCNMHNIRIQTNFNWTAIVFFFRWIDFLSSSHQFNVLQHLRHSFYIHPIQIRLTVEKKANGVIKWLFFWWETVLEFRNVDQAITIFVFFLLWFHSTRIHSLLILTFYSRWQTCGSTDLQTQRLGS